MRRTDRSFLVLRPTHALLTAALAALAGCTVTLETIPRDVAGDGAAFVDGRAIDAVTVADGDDAASDRTTVDVVDTGDASADDASDASADDAGDATGDADAIDDTTTIDACVPTTEICNGLDDDCNGVVDEGIAPARCGTGACTRIGAGCIAGVNACVPGAPSAEVCNAIDDDCDGTVDNAPLPPTCGLGVCTGRVAQACTGGAPTACISLSVASGTPEDCSNNLDDNCNGVVNEGCGCNAYVAPRGNDANNGLSPTAPKLTIGSAITALANTGNPSGRVCVAAAGTSSACARQVYVEPVTMVEGISVFGGYNQYTWSRSAGCVTVIQAVNSQGVYFGHSLTRATQIDGFVINATANPGSTGVNAGITIQNGGVISNNIVTGAAAPTSAGIYAVVPRGANSDTPFIVSNQIFGSPDGTNVAGAASGVFASGLPVEIRSNTTVFGGRGTIESIGVRLENAGASIVTENAGIRGGASPLSIGIKVTGFAGGTDITRNTAIAGGPSAGSNGTATGSYGIAMVGCTQPGLRVTENATIGSYMPSGALAASTNDTAGIIVDGCDVAIASNTSISASVTSASSAAAVHCVSSSARCAISGNRAIVGLPPSSATTGVNRAAGVWIEQGAFAHVDNNTNVTGCVGLGRSGSCFGVLLDAAADATVIEANTVEPNNLAGYAAGIYGSNTLARIVNNRVHTENHDGIVVGTLGHSRSPIVHSNTVFSLGDSSATHLLATDTDGNTSRGPGGVFANNVAICFNVGSARASFFSNGSAPAAFLNNDLYGCEALYVAADGTAYNDVTMINGLSGGGSIVASNVSLPGGFVSQSDFHLTNSSPLRDIGTPLLVPAFDVDVDARPRGAGYDIGYDEN